MTTHVLIGGGREAGEKVMRKLMRDALAAVGCAPTPGAAPRLAYVGVASDDHAGFLRMMEGAWTSAGATIEPAFFARAGAKTRDALTTLSRVDVVFMSGGDVHHGMQVLAKRKVVDELRALAERKPFIGISAGSIMMAREWVEFPGDDEAKATRFDCLGVVPVCVDAHAEEDDWAELKTLLKLQHAHGLKRAVGYGLPTRGGLVVKHGKLAAIGAPVPRLEVHAGDAVHAAPLEAAP